MRMLRFAPHAFAIVAFAAVAMPTAAQEWPSGTVRVVVPYAAGGPVDVPARLLIDRLAAQTKGVFILENRPGAGGSIGLQAVVQAAPDGGTLLLTTSSVTMVPTIYPKLAFDPLRDLTSISLVTEVPISLAVRAASPFRDLADLITRAKADPGKYTFGSGGDRSPARAVPRRGPGIDRALCRRHRYAVREHGGDREPCTRSPHPRAWSWLAATDSRAPGLSGHRRAGARLCRDQLVWPVRSAWPAGRRAGAAAIGAAEGAR
jgi:hypothetical protein